MVNKIRIGIIGAGASGATATKACLEAGFDVVVYERTSETGGLWRYRDEDIEGVPSVAKSTVINSSKELTAFSDFPPPLEYSNFMHNTKMLTYFEMYMDSFGFKNYVRFRHEVKCLEPNVDYDSTGKWKVTTKNQKSEELVEDVFDGVMVCTGHHVQPSVPTFKDQNLFKGQILHSHSYKKPDNYSGKTVVVVGIGNLGGDASVELAYVAEKVYLSTRRGTWVINRVGPNGLPIDSIFTSRWFDKFDHNLYQLKPKHRFLSQHVMVNDALPDRILSGTVVIKGDINRFTENGVVFKGEERETSCDVVLLSTGYKITFPFISDSILDTTGNRVELYKNQFIPNLKHPKTLSFISLVQPVGAILPIGELQSRWFALLMSNKRNLPAIESMLADVDSNKQRLRNRFYESPKHTIQVDWIQFMDELATEVGVRPNLFEYFFTDPVLWKALVFGPSVSYQYRLKGPHMWSGARDAILTVRKRIEAPLRTRFTETYKLSQTNRFGFKCLLFIAFICFLVLSYFWIL